MNSLQFLAGNSFIQTNIIIIQMAIYVLLDKLNYHHADWVYRKYGLLDQMTDANFSRMERD